MENEKYEYHKSILHKLSDEENSLENLKVGGDLNVIGKYKYWTIKYDWKIRVDFRDKKFV